VPETERWRPWGKLVVYKLATGALVGVGLFLLAIGVQRWLDQRSAARVADTFMTAVERGDRETVLSLLLPASRARIEAAARPKRDTSHRRTPKQHESQHPMPQNKSKIQTTDGAGGDASLLTAAPGTTHRIHHVTIRGDRAIVELRTEKNGFVAKPVLYLARSKTSQWKVASIENGRVDPLWRDLEQRRARVAGQRTATELNKALSNRPGVSVLRTQPDDSDDQ